VKAIQKRMAKKLRFVYRNFPLRESHPHAQRAAEAAEAAGGQGRFWEMHDRLFERQFALEDDNLQEYAAELGLDVARFQRELAARVYEPRVREDFRSGVMSGVNGTPTFFINGVRHDDSWEFEPLLATLEGVAASTR
jgi:protein-disulfide isomerase